MADPVWDGAQAPDSAPRERAAACESVWVCHASEYDVMSALMVNLRRSR